MYRFPLPDKYRNAISQQIIYKTQLTGIQSNCSRTSVRCPYSYVTGFSVSAADQLIRPVITITIKIYDHDTRPSDCLSERVVLSWLPPGNTWTKVGPQKHVLAECGITRVQEEGTVPGTRVRLDETPEEYNNLWVGAHKANAILMYKYSMRLP